MKNGEISTLQIVKIAACGANGHIQNVAVWVQTEDLLLTDCLWILFCHGVTMCKNWRRQEFVYKW